MSVKYMNSKQDMHQVPTVAGGQCHQGQADEGKLFFHVGILVSLIGVV